MRPILYCLSLVALGGGGTLWLLAVPAGSDKPALREGVVYSVTIAAKELASLAAPVAVSVGDSQGILATKRLHAFDPDFLFTFRARATGPAHIQAPQEFQVSIDEAATTVSEQRTRWQDAQKIPLNQTIPGTADDRPYIPLSQTSSELTQGQHWFQFTAPSTQLAYFAVETPNGDVPSDVDVFLRNGETLEPYAEGNHQYVAEATQNFPGLASYRTRRIDAGKTYYLRVSANHPFYRLRTQTYPLPPYRNDPRQAVRTAMDFAVSLGDSWLNNIPRRGSVATRDTLQHPETQNCVACHPTQFTTRAYLTATGHGYAPVNLPAASNLIWQLRSNPRPLPGHSGLNWSRMIFSARTISSRLPVLLESASNLPGFGPAPRDIVQGSAGYLKLHYKGLNELAEAEADGASPAVSPLETALQSWQTMGLAGEPRAALEAQIRAFEPRNTIDLNWKIIALAAIDPSQPQALEPWIAKLLQYQRADLRFPYEFERAAPGADFITYHALYALAAAGLQPEDKRVAPLVSFTLANQLPSGGWQGEPGPKAFHTPFRETQFAIMALSTLFPETLRPNAARVTKQAGKSPVERAAHAAALALPDLWPLLSDASKAVRIAAAESIRRKLSVSSTAADTERLTRALASSDSRTRSGALHVFAKQFRDLAGNRELRRAVLSRLSDPAPLIRLQAAAALSRWATWEDGDETILHALSARLDHEPDARIRRILTEGISGILDENIGYAEAWMRAMSDADDRQKTVDALHARSKRQAAILARYLDDRGSRRDTRLALLNSLWDLPLRHMAIPEESRTRAEVVLPAYYSEYSGGVADFENYPPYKEALGFRYGARNGFHKTRIGNDSEPVDLSGAGPELESALIRILRGNDVELRIAALKAGAALGASMSRAFTKAAIEVLIDGDEESRRAARSVFENSVRGQLTLGDPEKFDQDFVDILAVALDPKHPDALAVVLPQVAELPAGSLLSRNPQLMGRIDALLFERPVHPKALQAASAFPRVADGPLMRTVILDALAASGQKALQATAAEVVVKAYLADPTMPELARQFSAAARGDVRRMMLDLLDPQRFSLRLSALSLYNPPPNVVIPPNASLFSGAKVQEFVASSLLSEDEDVRAAALDLTAQYPELRRTQPVMEALEAKPAEARPRSRAIESAVRAGLGFQDTKAIAGGALDFQFFVDNVEPLFARTGSDGKACAMCHATHGKFPLRVPVRGKFTAQQSRENFRFASGVVDLANPQKSLLLIKPTRPNDSAGDPNLYLATHNGGERWVGNETSIEYQTVLRWIRGAGTGSGSAAGRASAR